MKQSYIEEFDFGTGRATVVHTRETFPSQEEEIRKFAANWFADNYQARTIVSVSAGRHQSTWSICWRSDTYIIKEKDMTYNDKLKEKKERAELFLKAFEEFLDTCPPEEDELRAADVRYQKSHLAVEKIKAKQKQKNI